MVSLYQDENIERLKKKRVLSFIAYAAAAAAVLAFCGAMCVLLQKTRRTYFIWLGAAAFCLGGWAILLDYFCRIYPLNVKIRHMRAITTGERRTIAGSVEKIDGPITREKGVSAYRIKILCGDGQRYVYWNEACGAVPFSAGDAIRVDTSERYAVAYEVNHIEHH